VIVAGEVFAISVRLNLISVQIFSKDKVLKILTFRKNLFINSIGLSQEVSSEIQPIELPLLTVLASQL
jgi:hypothetical protein